MINDLTLSPFTRQFISEGNADEVLKALQNCLQSIRIPFLVGSSIAQENDTAATDEILLFDPHWGGIGRAELIKIDGTQSVIRIHLPPFPNESEIEKYEQEIRETLPPPGMTLWLFDATGEREKALTYLGKLLHEHRLRCLQEIQIRLTNGMGLVPFGMLLIRERPDPKPGISRIEHPPLPNQNMNRDTPFQNNQPMHYASLRKDEQELLRLWRSGLTAKGIALRTGKAEKTVLNKLTILRKSYGEEVVHRRK